MNIKNFARKFAAFSASALVLFGTTALTGVAQAAPATDNYSFTQCVENKDKASVLVMMDESSSIYKTDKDNMRIAGVEILLDRLQQVSDIYGKNVNVLLAGYGDKFVKRSNEWVAIEPKAASNGLKKLVTSAREWSKKDSMKNHQETDILSGLEGATNELKAQDKEACKLFVFFKDGADFQYFNPASKSTVDGFPDIAKLLATGDAKKILAAQNAAEDEICRPGGLADKLRQVSDVYTLGVALNPGNAPADFSKFKAVIEGHGSSSCPGGSEDAHGRMITVDKVSDLPWKFANALDPNFDPSRKNGKFVLTMKRALTSITVLSAGVDSAFSTYVVTPPATCSTKEPFEIGHTVSVNNGELGGGAVKWNATWLGADDAKKSQTLNLVLSHENADDDSCWEGDWTIDPGNQDASSTLYFNADLSAIAKFDNNRAILVKSATDPMAMSTSPEFSIALEHPSKPGIEVLPAELDEDLSVEIRGELVNAKTKEHVNSSFDSLGALTLADLAKKQTISSSETVGEYLLVLTLDVKVAGFTENLLPVSSQRPVTIKNPFAAPTISTASVSFGTLEGKAHGQGSVTFKGSPDGDFLIDMSKPQDLVRLGNFPKNTSYVLLSASGEKQIVIPSNGEKTVDFELAADLGGAKEVRANGDVGGQLVFATRPKDMPDAEPYLLETQFDAYQKADASVPIAIGLILVLVLVGIGATLGALLLITWLVGRFPPAKVTDAQQLWAVTIPVSFNKDSGLLDPSSIEATANDGNQYAPIRVDAGRKSADMAGITFRVKTHSFSLSPSGVGHAQVANTGVVGFSAIDGNLPAMPLSLASSWAFYVDKASLGFAASGQSLQGTLVVLSNGPVTDPLAGFFQQANARLDDLMKSSKSDIEMVTTPDFTAASDFDEFSGTPTPAPAAKKSFGFGKKSKPEPTQTSSNNQDSDW